jgi:hypothetical protein
MLMMNQPMMVDDFYDQNRKKEVEALGRFEIALVCFMFYLILLAIGSFILVVKAPETVPILQRDQLSKKPEKESDALCMDRFYQKIEDEADLAHIHLLYDSFVSHFLFFPSSISRLVCSHSFFVFSFSRLQQPLFLVAWRGAQSVGLHVSKHERQSLRNLFLARSGVFGEVDDRTWTCEEHGQGMAIEKKDSEGTSGETKKKSKK